MSMIVDLLFIDRDLEIKVWVGFVRWMIFELFVSYFIGDVEWVVGCVRLKFWKEVKV